MKNTRQIKVGIIFYIISLFSLNELKAQLDLSQLKTPTSPAFIIIDQTPSTIDRPSSLNALTTSIQGAYVDGKFKPGVGIETTPFWLFKKTNYSLDRYLEANLKNDYGTLFLRHLSFSFATSSTDTFRMGNLSPGLGLSYGVRFLIIPGVEPKSKRDEQTKLIQQSKIELGYGTRLNTLKNSLPSESNIIYGELMQLVTSRLTTENGALISLFEEKFKDKETITVAEVKAFIDELLKEKSAVLVKNAKEISSWLSSAREGFMWEVAAAGLHNLPESSIKGEGNQLAKASIWTTLSYRANLDKDEVAQSVDVMLLARYIYNNKKVDSSDYFDVGLKAAYNHKKWSLSFEGAFRRILTPNEVDTNTPEKERPKNYTYRLATSFDYQINSIIGLNISFGRQFDGRSTTYLNSGSGQSIFSTAGLNIGIGQLSQNNN